MIYHYSSLSALVNGQQNSYCLSEFQMKRTNDEQIVNSLFDDRYTPGRNFIEFVFGKLLKPQ